MQFQKPHIEEIFSHAREALPQECCGLLGGREGLVSSVYKLRNIAESPLVEYESAPEDLFKAQREMRGRGEILLGIYHSHPRQEEPLPSETDVRRAFYPDAVYFIVGFVNEEPVLRAFKIYESERRYERIGFEVIE